MTPTESDWQIRLFVYESLVANGEAPSVCLISRRFAISPADVQSALQRLHDAHALVLQENADEVLMAPPLSAAPTDYRVNVGGVGLYANCAWDSLGIPAMLGCDAKIEARHPLAGDVMRYAVQAGELKNGAGNFVHFAHPFREWYDDIVDT